MWLLIKETTFVVKPLPMLTKFASGPKTAMCKEVIDLFICICSETGFTNRKCTSFLSRLTYIQIFCRSKVVKINYETKTSATYWSRDLYFFLSLLFSSASCPLGIVKQDKKRETRGIGIFLQQVSPI